MSQIKLDSGYDLNILRRRGHYLAPAAQNAPTTGATWVVEVESGPVAGVSFALQVATNVTTGARHTRTNSGGTWTNWSAVGSGSGGPADTDELPEGSANLYFTAARQSAVSTAIADAVAAHEAAANPHPGYLTEAEADALYEPLGGGGGGGGGGRTLATANLTLYVATTGNDTTGDGTSGTPYATLTKAWQVLCAEYDGGGYDARIVLGDGTYGDQLMLENPLGWTNIRIGGGDGSVASDVVVNTLAIGQKSHARLNITIMKFNRTTGTSRPLTFLSTGGGRVEFGDLEFQLADADVDMIGVNGQWFILAQSPLYMDGTCARLLYAERGCFIEIDTVTPLTSLTIGEELFSLEVGATLVWLFPGLSTANANYFTYRVADGANFITLDPSGFPTNNNGAAITPRTNEYAPIKFTHTGPLAPGDVIHREVTGVGLQIRADFSGPSAGYLTGVADAVITLNVTKDGTPIGTVTLFTDETVAWATAANAPQSLFGGQLIEVEVASGTTATPVTATFSLAAFTQP